MSLSIKKDNIRSEYILKIIELSGENITACYHCGKCSAGCPSVDEMEILPNQLIRAIQLGDIEKLQNVNTPWICASCNMCYVRCPRGLDLCSIMEGVRQMILRDNVDWLDINKMKDNLGDLPPIAIVGAQRKLTS